jgi:hypothetical protein
LVARVFAKQNQKNIHIHVASPVGEIQLEMYCNPRPYHGLYVKVQSGSKERGGALTTYFYLGRHQRVHGLIRCLTMLASVLKSLYSQ